MEGHLNVSFKEYGLWVQNPMWQHITSVTDNCCSLLAVLGEPPRRSPGFEANVHSGQLCHYNVT